MPVGKKVMKQGMKRKAEERSIPAPVAKRTKREGPYTQYKGKAIPLKAPRILTASKAPKFKAFAWNVGGIRAFLDKRISLLKRLVKDEKPSVIGILETKLQEGQQVADAEQVLKAALPEYDHVVFNCSTAKKGYSGTALLVHKSVRSMLQGVTIQKDDTEGRVIVAQFTKFFLVLCYTPNSGDGLVRLDERIKKWDPNFRKRLKTLEKKGKPVLLMGDLNAAHLDLDIWNVEAPHIPLSASTTPEERESFGALLDSGFVDGVRHFFPETLGMFSYWSIRAGNRKPNRGLRLDYAVVSASMVKKGASPALVDAFHLPALCPAGDHCPVGASLKW